MNKKILLMMISFVLISPVSATSLDDINVFLMSDITDKNEYLPWYTCGHYARDLVRNASEYNITLGSVLLSNHPVFRGKWNSHVINYIEINDTIYFIEPQTDEVFCFNDLFGYRYGRYYYNGDMVPSHWNVNLAHHFDLNKEVM